MKLFLVHCGFYDESVGAGLYESHVNYLIAAEDFQDARERIKRRPEFKARRMHVDGLQEITAVDGFDVTLEENAKLEGKTITANQKYGSRSPKQIVF